MSKLRIEGEAVTYGIIRLSGKILDDPKVGTLSDRLYRRYIEFLLIAAGNDRIGYLPDIETLEWWTRVSVEDLWNDISELLDGGLLRPIDDNDGNPLWYVVGSDPPPMTRREVMRYQFNRQRKVIFDQLVERDGEYCRHCGSVHELSVDHALAIANGGTNDLNNLQLLCRSCNSRKGAR